MKSSSVTDAKDHFGQLVDMAQAEPICITRHGREVAIIMSPDEFRRLTSAARANGNPTVEHLHAESAKRWASVYAALAK